MNPCYEIIECKRRVFEYLSNLNQLKNYTGLTQSPPSSIEVHAGHIYIRFCTPRTQLANAIKIGKRIKSANRWILFGK